MCDGFPRITLSIISYPTNFIQRRLHLSIINSWPGCCIGPSVCCANAFQTGSKYDVAVRRACTVFPWARLALVVFLWMLLSDVLAAGCGCGALLFSTDCVRQWHRWVPNRNDSNFLNANSSFVGLPCQLALGSPGSVGWELRRLY